MINTLCILSITKDGKKPNHNKDKIHVIFVNITYKETLDHTLLYSH